MNVNTEDLLRRGKRFLDFGEIEAAKDEFLKAVSADESNAQAWYLLGLSYRDLKNANEARRCLKEAISRDPDWLDPLEALGSLEFTLDNDREAVKYLKKYLDKGGSDIDALLTLARSASEAEDCRTVLKATSKIIELNEDLPDVWVLRGLCQAKMERFNAACTSLNIAVDLHPGYVSALNTVGDLSYKAKNYPVAIDLYEESLKQSMDQPEILFRLGIAYWFQDQWASAIPLFQKYVELVPDDPRGWNNLGVALREKGDVKMAMECYAKALALDETLEEPKHNMETAKEMRIML